MKQKNRISVEEAAFRLQIPAQAVRLLMQSGKLPIGECIKTSSRWTYYIWEEKLENYIESS